LAANGALKWTKRAVTLLEAELETQEDLLRRDEVRLGHLTGKGDPVQGQTALDVAKNMDLQTCGFDEMWGEGEEVSKNLTEIEEIEARLNMLTEADAHDPDSSRIGGSKWPGAAQLAAREKVERTREHKAKKHKNVKAKKTLKEPRKKWVCEVCNARFLSRDQAEAHETRCKVIRHNPRRIY